MIKLLVDNKEVEAEEGANLLQTCLDNGIYIPNLCYREGMENPSASCRMCLVEVDGGGKPITSCTAKVRDGMVVRTDTPSVRKLQRSALQLLLSVHDVDCARCPANKRCELQRIAKFLKVGLKPKRLERLLKETDIVEEHPLLDYHPNRCVLCGKCIHTCQDLHGKPVLTFTRRGFDTTISFYGESDSSSLPCEKCMSCVEICPVGAITRRNSHKQEA